MPYNAISTLLLAFHLAVNAELALLPLSVHDPLTPACGSASYMCSIIIIIIIIITITTIIIQMHMKVPKMKVNGPQPPQKCHLYRRRNRMTFTPPFTFHTAFSRPAQRRYKGL